MNLTEKQREFLERLRDDRTLAIADREEDRARQACRKAGLAECVMSPRRWVITAAGRACLQDKEKQP